jgi:InsA C-terminal domain
VKQQIIDMTLNGSGVRDIVRVLRVSSATVIDVLKKKEPTIKQVNERLLKSFDPAQLDISFGRLRPPRWMKCGALWAAKASRAGCGTPSNITQDSS